MSQEISALESRCLGYVFRSRMEARWAIFMDALKVPFHYELEAFNLGGICYLPDFYLPTMDVFIEVKSPLAGPVDYEKIQLLADHTRKAVYVVKTPPEAPCVRETKCGYVWHGSLFDVFDRGGDEEHLWCQCRKCGALGIEWHGLSNRIECGCNSSNDIDWPNFDTDTLVAAYNKSKSWRFDGAKVGAQFSPTKPNIHAARQIAEVGQSALLGLIKELRDLRADQAARMAKEVKCQR